MVDDGSTDGSAEICRGFARRDERFLLVREKHRGSAGARNVGLEHISGDCVAFLDSDDWYDDDFLEFLHRDMEMYDADICYCNFRVKEQPKYSWNDAVLTGSETLCELLTAGCSNETPNKLYKRSTVEGLSFPEGRDLCEDAAFTARALVRAKKVVRRSEPKYNIRLTKGSVTRKHFRRESEICAFYRNLLDRCKVFLDNYPSDPDQQKMVVEECRRCLKLALDSGMNLDHWNVYGTGRELATTYADKLDQGDTSVFRYYRKYKDYRTCEKAYLRDTLRSKREPVKEKARIVSKYAMSSARRLYRREREIVSGSQNDAN